MCSSKVAVHRTNVLDGLMLPVALPLPGFLSLNPIGQKWGCAPFR